MEHTAAKVKTYSPVIESARGVAALSVLLFHAYIWIYNPNAPILFSREAINYVKALAPGEELSYYIMSLFFLGVNLFFVVSGFCIHIGYFAKRTTSLKPKEFFLRRLIRIYPLYFVVFAFLFILYGPILGRYDEKGVTLLNFVGHVFFWHYLGSAASAGMGISAVLWTIAIEVQFYILYFLVYPLIIRGGVGRLAFIFLCLEVVYRCVFQIWHLEVVAPIYLAPSRFAVLRFGEWLLGAYLAELYVSGRLSRLRFQRWALISLGVALIGVCAVVGKILGLDKYASTDVPAAIGFTLILGALLAKESAIAGNTPTLSSSARFSFSHWLGVRCFSLYLTHATIVLAVGELVGRRSFIDPHGEFIQIYRLAAAIGAISMSFLIAAIAYRSIEAPSHQLAKRISRAPDEKRATSPLEPVSLPVNKRAAN